MRQRCRLLPDRRLDLWRRAHGQGQDAGQAGVRVPRKLPRPPEHVQGTRDRQAHPRRPPRPLQDARQPRVPPVAQALLGHELPRRRVRRRRSARRRGRARTVGGGGGEGRGRSGGGSGGGATASGEHLARASRGRTTRRALERRRAELVGRELGRRRRRARGAHRADERDEAQRRGAREGARLLLQQAPGDRDHNWRTARAGRARRGERRDRGREGDAPPDAADPLQHRGGLRGAGRRPGARRRRGGDVLIASPLLLCLIPFVHVLLTSTPSSHPQTTLSLVSSSFLPPRLVSSPSLFRTHLCPPFFALVAAALRASLVAPLCRLSRSSESSKPRGERPRSARPEARVSSLRSSLRHKACFTRAASPPTPLSLPSPPLSAPTPAPSGSTAGMAAVHTAMQQHPAPLQGQAPLFSFTQGVLLGQASMIILAALFLKYVVFEDPEAARRVREERRRARQEEAAGAGAEDGEGGERKKKDRKGKKAAPRTPPDFPAATLSAASLLSSLSYDLSSHAPESLDWLNVLLAQLISSYRLLAASHSAGGARQLVEEALNRRTGGTEEGAEASQGMVGLDFIEVDEVELGDGFPALSAARVRPSGVGGESVRVELDLDYSDQVLLAVSTRVVLNFPRPRFAVLPVSLSVTLERFSGTLTVELPPPVPAAADPSDPHQHHHAHPTLHLSLHPDFELQLATSSLLGSRAKLQDVPKVEQLLSARIRAAIQDRIVWPGRIEVALPGVKPHHHRHAHRHGEDSEPVAPLADDRAASPLSGATSPLSDPLFPHTPPSPSSPLAADSPLHFSAPLPPNPLLARTQSAASSFTNGTGTPETPSVDLSAPEGPSIALHPRVRPAPPATAAQAHAQAGATPSPSESLPGYFPPGAAGLSGLAGKRVGGTAPGAAGMRYRTTAGAAAGVGIGVGVGR